MSCKRGPAGGCPALGTCRGWSHSPRDTHDPHAVKGHLGVELRHHVLPPVQGLGAGEVGEGGESGPHLQERPEGRPGRPQSYSLARLPGSGRATEVRVGSGRGRRGRQLRPHFQTKAGNRVADICTPGGLPGLPSAGIPFPLVVGPGTGSWGVCRVPRGKAWEAPGRLEDMETLVKGLLSSCLGWAQLPTKSGAPQWKDWRWHPEPLTLPAVTRPPPPHSILLDNTMIS